MKTQWKKMVSFWSIMWLAIVGLYLMCVVALPNHAFQKIDMITMEARLTNKNTIKSYYDCEETGFNYIRVTGQDPLVVYGGFEQNQTTIVLRFLGPQTEIITGYLYVDYGGGFNAENCYLAQSQAGEDMIYWTIPEGTYYQIRIDIEQSYRYLWVELHNDVPTTNPMSFGLVIRGVLIALAIILIPIIIDLRVRYSQKAVDFLLADLRKKKE